MISIIIPVYNGEQYIRKSLESILNQTYKNIEVIVVDDGSTDGTAQIVRSYLGIKYYYQKNSGPSAARNLGIKVSQGDFIALQDADDISLPYRIERQRKIFDDFSDIDVVYNAVNIIDEEDNVLNTLRSEGLYENKNDFLAMTLFRQLMPCPPSIMLRRHCFNVVNYSELYINAEDYLLTIELAKRFNFKYIDDVLYFYRRHRGNLTNKHSKQIENEINITKDFGIDNIKSVVDNTSFDNLTKNLLLAKIFIKIRCFTEAINLIQYNIKHYNNEYMWFYLGICHSESNHIIEAKKCFEESVKKNAGLAEAYNNLGCCLAYLSDSEQAMFCFSKAIELKKGYHDPIVNLGLIKSNSDKYKLTLRELRNVLSSYKEN